MRTFIHVMLAMAPVLLAASGAARGQDSGGAIYVVTYLEMQAASTREGAVLLKRYRETTRHESGNTESEVGQEIGRPNRFVLFEAWHDQQAFDAHEKADATTRIREQLKAIQHNPPDQRVNHGFDVVPAPLAKGALYVETHVDVIPPRQAATEAALKQMAAETRRDAGNLRWDVLQQLPPRTNHFNIFALWKTAKNFDAHETTAHRAQFRDTLAPMLGALYDERLYKPL